MRLASGCNTTERLAAETGGKRDGDDADCAYARPMLAPRHSCRGEHGRGDAAAGGSDLSVAPLAPGTLPPVPDEALLGRLAPGRVGRAVGLERALNGLVALHQSHVAVVKVDAVLFDLGRPERRRVDGDKSLHTQVCHGAAARASRKCRHTSAAPGVGALGQRGRGRALTAARSQPPWRTVAMGSSRSSRVNRRCTLCTRENMPIA